MLAPNDVRGFDFVSEDASDDWMIVLHGALDGVVDGSWHFFVENTDEFWLFESSEGKFLCRIFVS